ncbi:MAG TPA: hypothetical protein VFP37_19475 [Steroidobacteraceae bacterium]|nr:hypothetical protein [Steroidobacteraceae bacterium]
MNRQIESRLDRSLANQLRVPQLDRRFDAAVWARIEAEERARARAAAPVVRSAAAPRWLFASNVAGFVVAALLVAYFGARVLAGIEVDLSAVPVPSLSPEQRQATVGLIGWGITIASLAFGLMFTPLGRRVRSVFT